MICLTKKLGKKLIDSVEDNTQFKKELDTKTFI